MPHTRRSHRETHRTARTGWLRAAVLGANDGIVSTASLVVGVASATANVRDVLVAGVAGLVAGAMSMAVGEYVSVSSQSDTERADLDRERAELAASPQAELNELAGIYEKRGVDPQTARLVAEQMTAHDALGAHARDELGLTEELAARPVQAAVFSAASFAVGAAVPLGVIAMVPAGSLIAAVVAATAIALIALGWLSAHLGGAPIVRAVARVVLGGLVAMAITWAVGKLFAVPVA